MRKFLTLLLTFGLAFGTFSMIGCQQDLGDTAEEAVEEVGDEVDDAT